MNITVKCLLLLAPNHIIMKKLLCLLLIAVCSIFTLRASTGYDTLTICQGQSILVNGVVIDQAGQYNITFQPGDSLVIYTVNVSTPFVSLGEDMIVCERTLTPIIPKGSDGYYTWSNGSVANSIFAGVSGIYSVTVTDAFGCTADDSVSITIMQNPNPVIEGIVQPICYGSSDVVLTGLPAGGEMYGDLLNGNLFLASQAPVGFYNIYYSYTDSFGCSATVNAYIQVAICNQLETNLQTLPIIVTAESILLPGEADFTIYQINGRIAETGITKDAIIQLINLQPGMYIVELYLKNKQTRHTITIRK